MSLSAQGNVSVPDPLPTSRHGYLGPVDIAIDSYMGLQELVSLVESPVTSMKPTCMEELVWKGNGYGQNFGYIYYSTNITHGGNLNFTSTPTDRNEIFVDDAPVATHDVHDTDLAVSIPSPPHNGQDMTLGILVENRGRVNYAMMPYNFLNEQRKGINSDILLDNQAIHNWSIYPLDFSKDFIKSSPYKLLTPNYLRLLPKLCLSPTNARQTMTTPSDHVSTTAPERSFTSGITDFRDYIMSKRNQNTVRKTEGD
ncbi:beta-galactosidase-1-like protein 2 isoform X2 [Pecten maximus]|uniref:beta-galactosidase-1-like protein 2 isoform X2 n=1 Tax=Pecten maximus TaxID=6579 RepID=UPI001458132B|nr:beta-galactosidase-1-like protein 2 isoform X2 [Pecten maximus]